MSSSVGKDIEQTELSYSAYESVNWCSYSGKGFRQPILKLKNTYYLGPNNSTPDIYPTEMMNTYVHQKTCTIIFWEVLF